MNSLKGCVFNYILIYPFNKQFIRPSLLLNSWLSPVNYFIKTFDRLCFLTVSLALYSSFFFLKKAKGTEGLYFLLSSLEFWKIGCFSIIIRAQLNRIRQFSTFNAYFSWDSTYNVYNNRVSLFLN